MRIENELTILWYRDSTLTITLGAFYFFLLKVIDNSLTITWPICQSGIWDISPSHSWFMIVSKCQTVSSDLGMRSCESSASEWTQDITGHHRRRRTGVSDNCEVVLTMCWPHPAPPRQTRVSDSSQVWCVTDTGVSGDTGHGTPSNLHIPNNTDRKQRDK